MTAPARLPVRTQADVEAARRAARAMATDLGFPLIPTEETVLAVSELAVNLVRYADSGEILLAPTERGGVTGLVVESRDRGPGIADVTQALAEGYSTGGGLGAGLPAVRRLLDEFAIESSPAGTRVVGCKWMPGRS